VETVAILIVIIFTTLILGQLIGLALGSNLGEGEKPALWGFLGVSGVVLGMQNLVYLGIPIRTGSAFLFFLLGVLFFARPELLRRVWAEWLCIDKIPFFMALAVFLIQGLGLLIRGCQKYVGRGWHDLFNYVATAQFLVDHPFRTCYEQNLLRPYLAIAIAKKDDRIGASVLQGFYSVITGQDAAVVAGPTILLGAPLTALAVYLLSIRYGLSKRVACWAGLFSGSLPALAMLHLECFLSQVLAIPFLLLWPYILSRCFEKPCWSWLLLTSAFLATGVSIYTEFLPIFAGLGAVFFCLICCIGGHIVLRDRLLLALGIGLGAMAWNPLFVLRGWEILHRLISPGTLEGIYPWARQLQGLAVLFFGDSLLKLSPAIQWVLTGLSTLLILLALVGLLVGCTGKNLSFRVTALALGFLPLIPFSLGKYPYQSYKLLLSVAPISAVGLCLISLHLEPYFCRLWGKRAVLRQSLAYGLFVSIAACTLGMNWRAGTGSTMTEIGRGGAHRWSEAPIQATRAYLESSKKRSFLVDWTDDFFGGAYLNGWLAYWGRHHRVWLANPRISDGSVPGPDFDFRKAGPEFYFLSQLGESRVAGSSVSMAWSFKPVTIHKFLGEDWAILSQLKNPNGLESDGLTPFIWVGGEPSEIIVLAGRKGILRIEGLLGAGPYLPKGSEGILIIKGPDSWEKRLMVQKQTSFDWRIPVEPGKNQIEILCADEPVVPPGAPDPRPLLVQVRGLRISGFE
jgi:hypothetical protein